jgi:tetratricopeptide (TPR) repeat protein
MVNSMWVDRLFLRYRGPAPISLRAEGFVFTLKIVLLLQLLIAWPVWAAGEGAHSGVDSNANAPEANSGTIIVTPELTAEQMQVRISGLISQLGDERYIVRQAAQNELSRIGPEAYDALTGAEGSPDIEISSRAKYLVQAIRVQWIHQSDSPQVRHILDKYELQDESGRLVALRQLADLQQDAGLAPLCHLLRFEKSPLVSRYTAMLIINQPEDGRYWWSDRRKTIEANLVRNSGPGAQWLRAYIHYRNDPQAAAAEIDKLVDTELEDLTPFANEMERQNTLTLAKPMVSALQRKFDRGDRAKEVLQKLVPLMASDPQTISEFANMLVQHQAWKLIDELAHRGEVAFNNDPTLLYTLAHSRRAQGNTVEADELSKRAFELIGDSVELHAELGHRLSKRGLFEAAESEYQHVIKKSPQDTELTIEVQGLLGEMLHDQEHNQEAAKVLKTLVDAMDKDATVLQRVKESGDTYPDNQRGQMHLYYACYYAALHKYDEQRRELEEGAKCDPTNPDILIGLYEISANDPARRKQVLDMIRAADAGYREEIYRVPNDPKAYNEDAWLIGNTEGDFDLAIQYSQQSLALATEGEQAGLLDTLAHCYAGKGDYENAVQYQTRAAELEPHTLQITKALDKFTKKLAERHDEK